MIPSVKQMEGEESTHPDALEKEMATHSSVLACRIPGMAEPGELPSMVEELPAADDREVGEEVAQALEASHAEQQQVLGDDGELGEAVAAVVLGLGNEQDVEVALNHRAVLQALQLLVVVADVDARPADCRDTRGEGSTGFSYKESTFHKLVPRPPHGPSPGILHYR